MLNTLFLQSDIENPYEIYSQMLSERPIFWDEKNGLWAVYSYKYCEFLLNNNLVQIPVQNNASSKPMSEFTTLITGKIARLSNPPNHVIAKQVALQLFEKLQSVNINALLDDLTGETNDSIKIDWVEKVCKKLPALAVLKGFEFSDTDINFILPRIEHLTKIMLPTKTEQQIVAINEIAEGVYSLVEKHIVETGHLTSLIKKNTTSTSDQEVNLSLYVSNLIGLLIQCYDAGRGLLSNALLQLLLHYQPNNRDGNDFNYFQQSVIETLRYDPPIHNTRRVAVDDILLDGNEIKKEQAILIVLAAANRDQQKFENSNKFNVLRANNDEHLTFGNGHHMCLAKHFSVNLTANALMHLFKKYREIKLLENNIKYERIINARLAKEIYISMTP